MTSVWSALLPVAAVSALVPMQLAVTILLLRSESGRFTAAAWVAGMTSIRLMQGLVFGLVLSSSASASGATDPGGPALVVSVILLVLGLLSYAAAAGAWIKDVDPDAPPPKWLGVASTVGPVKAFAAGAALLLVSAKFWVLTLGAIASIGAAGVGRTSGIADFLVFVLLAESLHLIIIGSAFLAPTTSASTLDSVARWLERNNRTLVITLGLVFGTWFAVKALSGLGLL